MRQYRVKWEIDVEADSPKDAAKQALAAQCRPGTTATVFDVRFGTHEERIDLLTPSLAKIQQALKRSEEFISGFEDDEIQTGVGELLALLRGIITEINEQENAVRDVPQDSPALFIQSGTVGKCPERKDQ